MKTQTAFVPFGLSCKNKASDTLENNQGSDILVSGSTVAGKGGTRLKADDDIVALAWVNTNSLNSSNKSSGGSIGMSAGGSFGAGVPSVSGSYSNEKIKANHVTANEVSGIYGGSDGFDIDVAGQTSLTGAVIASGATADKNTLATGTLVTKDLENQSDYKASSMGASVSYSGTDSEGKQSGYKGFNAGLPSFMQATDSESSTTRSGIAAGTVTIRDQEEQQAATGQSAAQTVASLNRDVTLEMQDATGLTNLYERDKDKIATGFEIVKTLSENTQNFMSIMVKDLDAAANQPAVDKAGNPIYSADGQTQLTNKQAYEQGHELADTTIQAKDPNGKPLFDTNGNPIIEQTLNYGTRQALWGNGGTGSMVLTGLVGAASGNVTGSGAALLQNSAINVVRQLGAQQIKGIADGFMDNGKPTDKSELIRGALHAIAGCAGASATGGDCASAATSSAATVGLNNLVGLNPNDMTAEQKQAYSNLMGTLVAGVASGVGGDAAAAQLASKIEVEDNFLTRADAAQYASSLKACNGNSACEDEARKKAIQAYQRNEAALELAKLRGDLKAYNALLATAASSSEIPFDGTAMFRNKADAVSGGANLEQERDIKYIAGIRSSRCSGLSLNACDNVVYEQLRKDGKQAATFLGSALTAGAGGLLVQAVGGGTKAAAVGAGLGVASNGAAQYAYNRDGNKSFSENISNLDKTDLAVAGVTGALGVGRGFWGNIAINEGGYVVSKNLNGEDVTLAGAGATALGTAAGYGFGKYVPPLLAPYVSYTLRPGLTKLDPTKSILFQMKPQKAILTKKLPAWTKPLPAFGGTVGAPTLQEFSTPVFEKGINWLDRKRVFP